MGETLNASTDLVPAENFYEACRIISSHVVHRGGTDWDFAKLHTIPIDPAFTRLVENYLATVLSSETRWRGWKLPETTLALPWIVRLFPDINYVYLIRDPRDAILGRHLTDDLGDFGIPHERVEDARLRRAMSWKYQVELVKSTPKPKHWHTVRFEDFVLRQSETLRDLEAKLGLTLARIPVNRHAVGRWRRDDGLHHFDVLTPDLLEYGYIRQRDEVSRAERRVREKVTDRARWRVFLSTQSLKQRMNRRNDETTRRAVPPRPNTADEVAELRALCNGHSLKSSVTRVVDGQPEWIMDSGRLRNTKADYFSIGVHEPRPGRSLLMMEQREPALILLLVADVGGVESVLVNLRTEPGLIGFTNITTTIQSTASNYTRRHGGKATPFIEVAADPHSFGTVVYDGEQYDWGGYYAHKTKRFLIVKLSEAVDAPPGYRWISTATARALLLEDNLITNDLRVSLPHLLEPQPFEPAREADRAAPDRSGFFSAADYPVDFVDCRGTKVSFFRTQTATREVQSWVQPLLEAQGPMVIQLLVSESDSGRVFAVEMRSQAGLLGRRLWFPARTAAGMLARRVNTSAEGGRFWQLRICLEILQVEQAVDAPNSGVVWMTEEELAQLVAQPLQTSLELRMAWSVICAE